MNASVRWKFGRRQSRSGRLTAIIAAALMLLPLPALAARRFDVPITAHVLPDGNVRFTVPVRIGDGRPMAAMLDTGSFGLRVLSRALAPHQYEPTGIVRRYDFQSGVVLTGPLAWTKAQIGTPGPRIPATIQVVRSIECSNAKPRCPAARLSPAEYGLGGDGIPYQGFDAILGLSLRGVQARVAALNPLADHGDRRWIIILPKPGQRAPGHLIINPDERDVAGFHRVALDHIRGPGGRPQLADGRIPNCPEEPLEQQMDCPKMRIDTGASRGVQPFYDYEILFNAARGAIAVKRRED
ncbi:hypothetical protein [Brucella sp. IR073]|uniref:hypothetical protein n=1 Tax=unclassified Brucella TaxID=2632610 RepID=UPI003B985D00